MAKIINTKVSEKADFKIEDGATPLLVEGAYPRHERTERCKDLWRC